MKEFEYFLFENFDADEESQNPNNPRNFLGKETDAIISLIAQKPANTCTYSHCCAESNTCLVKKLISGGILRLDGTILNFDCPVFLRDDAVVLYKAIAEKAVPLVNMLESKIAEIRACCSQIHNDFSIEQNLYHILCGMVFDGYFFDYLNAKGVLITSRLHPSGLDYLNIIYEKCSELQALSNGLLCSYNRLKNDKCSLQSFGDANGERFDFYRFFRLAERKDIPSKFKNAKAMLYENYGGLDKDALLSDVVSLIQTGRCVPSARKLLEQFGYMQNGDICVPIYTPEHQRYITGIEDIVERSIGDAMSRTLIDLSSSIDITSVKHKVNQLEIANELYHIVFGLVNEELVSREIVAAPQQKPGEGRYFKCIELQETSCKDEIS